MKNTRRCKICKERFTPTYHMMQPTCLKPECLAEIGRRKVKEQVKKEVKVLEEKQKDVPYFKKKLQEKVQSIARCLDFGKGCISCGKPPIGVVHGGHRWNKHDFSSIRFDLHQISSQCYSCNVSKSANVDGYLKGLEDRYGKEYRDYVNSLPILYPETKLNLFEIKLAYAKAVKIEGELKRNLKGLTPVEVVTRKNEINENLGYHLQKFDVEKIKINS